MPFIYQTKIKVLIIFFTFSGVINAYAQTFQWAKRMGGTTGGHYLRSTATDAAGNIYLTGLFWGTVDFDPNAGIFNLSSYLGSQDVFVCKLSPAGNFVWAKFFPGDMPDIALDVTVDATGNVYVTGWFQGTVDFDPGAGTFNITTLGGSGSDGFLCKLSNTGNFVWAKRFGSPTGLDQGHSVITDAGGNVYLGGFTGGTLDTDPGPGVFNITGTGTNSNFLVKLNSAGNFIWAKQPGGFGGIISLDAGGNVYIASDFAGSIDFDPGAGTYMLTAAGSSDFSVTKLTTNGIFVWARKMGGAGSDRVTAIAVDAPGNVHTTGSFDDVCDFDPGAAVYNLTSTGVGVMARDMYISKLTTTGAFVWAKRIGGTSRVDATSIAVDATGNVYTTGSFFGTADFNPGAATNNLVATGTQAFISKLTAAGNYVMADNFGTTSYGGGKSIVVDALGSIIASGEFTGTGDFNPYSGVANLTSIGSQNIYVLKLYVSPLPIELLTFEATQNNNTVDITWQTATELNNDFFTIEKSSNGNEFEEIGKVTGAGNSDEVLNYSFTDEKPYTGISYYRLKQTDFNGEFSYSKTVAVYVNANANNPFLIYQNQSTAQLIIAFADSQKQPCQLYIHDMTGRVVFEQQVTSATAVINAAFLPGIYVANVSDGQQALTKKFIIK